MLQPPRLLFVSEQRTSLTGRITNLELILASQREGGWSASQSHSQLEIQNENVVKFIWVSSDTSELLCRLVRDSSKQRMLPFRPRGAAC